jgi:hypothetical protein
MKQQSVVTHTIRKSEISTLPDSCDTKTASVETPFSQKVACPCNFLKTLHA